MGHATRSPPSIFLIRAAWSALTHELKQWRSWYFLRRPVLWTLTIFCVTIAALKLGGGFSWSVSSASPPWRNQRVCVTGVVNAQPDKRPTGCVISVQLETVTVFVSTPATTQSSREHVLVQLLGTHAPSVSPGDRVRACGALREPASSEVPGVFDYADFLANRDVHGVMYTGASSFFNWGDSGRFRLARWGWRVKQRVVRRFEKTLSTEQAAVMAGLVVGERPRFHPELKEIFLRSGTMHVLVASGSNVAFVMVLWFILARCLRVPNSAAIGTSFAPVWAYVFISGGDAPIVRAAIMGSTIMLAHLWRRWDKPFNALGLAAWIILVANPRALFDVGFQMSFVTVAGLLLTMPHIEPLCAKMPRWLGWLVRALATSVVAQLWLFPISVHAFHHVYPWSVLSNMLVVPMAGLGLPMGLAIVISEKLGPIVSAYAQALLWLVTAMASYLGQRWWVAPLSGFTVIAWYVFCATLPFWRKRVIAGATGGISLLIVVGNCLFFNGPENTTDALSLTWVDTGRSLATFIERDNQRLLFLPRRGSEEQPLERALLPFIATRKMRPITVVLSETDEIQTSLLGSELLRSCSVSTVTVCAAPVVWVEGNGQSALIAPVFTTRLQRYLLRHARSQPDVIAAHFPPKWKWDDDFVSRFKPKLIVETGSPRRDAGNNPPWPDVPIVFPQKLGWYRWEGQRKGNPSSPPH